MMTLNATWLSNHNLQHSSHNGAHPTPPRSTHVPDKRLWSDHTQRHHMMSVTGDQSACVDGSGITPTVICLLCNTIAILNLEILLKCYIDYYCGCCYNAFLHWSVVTNERYVLNFRRFEVCILGYSVTTYSRLLI